MKVVYLFHSKGKMDKQSGEDAPWGSLLGIPRVGESIVSNGIDYTVRDVLWDWDDHSVYIAAEDDSYKKV